MAQLANNSRARYDYDIKDTYVAGLALSGAEVKAVKQGNISLTGSYITVSQRGAALVNCHIGPYKYARQEKYDPTHSRSLLLQKKELTGLMGKEKGLVIIPLEIFATPRGLIKLKLGVGRARKKTDKREYIKEREVAKEIRKFI